MARIVIIGAGISGVTAAYELKSAGHNVTVVDRHYYPAMETSYANGGQLSASNSEVWNTGATVLKAMRWIFRRDAPLLLNLSPSWHKYSWLAEFLWNIRAHRQNTIDTVRLALRARQNLRAIAVREGISFDLETRGILHICHDKATFQAGLKTSKLLAEGGLERFAVGAEEISRLEPALQGSFYGGFFTPSDASGDIHKFTRQLALICEKKGVVFLQDTTFNEISRSGRTHTISLSKSSRSQFEIDADALVVCAGVESRKIAAKLGDRVNVYPVKGYSITVHLNDAKSIHGAPRVSLLDEAAKIVASRLGDDRFRVAGTAELDGFNCDIRADRIRPLIGWVRANFPEIETSRTVPWAGLRPMMPSMLPVVGPGRRDGIYYHTGHGHLGWTLSTATAELLADVISARYPN